MNIALIFAGGTGQRMNSRTKPKQFLELNGKPIIIHTIDVFENHPCIDGIVVACLAEWIPYLKKIIEKYRIQKVNWVVPGGETGQQSIKNGLAALISTPYVSSDSNILIHDGVRPLIDTEVITSVLETMNQYGNAVTVTSAIETIVNVNERREVVEILDRSRCCLARAPQGFRLCDIWEAHQKAEKDGNFNMIDSAMLMAHYGAILHIVDGPVENIKITTPSDFYIFRAIYEAKENSQIWGG